ncbi:MAG TPA: glycosyltransferase family 2 protein [Elusimicrobiota bacterium]|nr:glycosyltransferase family 2 protein [Elusimicrobiota bacterium]
MTTSYIVIAAYILILFLLSLYGVHRYWILYLYWRHYKKAPPLPTPFSPVSWPMVTVQLPVYNEYYVVRRLIDAVCRLDYPKDRLEIQLLDDSTDESRELARGLVEERRREGFPVQYLHREHRNGFKAGALAEGLRYAHGEFIAIFDADFLPSPDFLRRTIPHFAEERIGMVQTRWGHLNSDYSFLTRAQALFLDGHFMLEHTARNRSGAFFNFNGTAGVWRRRTIEDAGGWADDTLTEDLDISYRAQLRGWKFLFLPEVVCPAELPVDIVAFRSQQHRWTKGALQVAKKVLPAIWKSPLPFFVKLESTVHLTSNLGYCLMFALSLLLLPSLMARNTLAWPQAVNLLEFFVFLLTALSITTFYAVVQRETKAARFSLADLPPLLAFGIGMCFNNTRAVWEALCSIPTEFRRTAKFNIQTRQDTWRNKRYRAARKRTGLVEALLAVYLLITLYQSLSGTAAWMTLPLIGLFLGGFAYVGWLTFYHALQKN